MKFSFVLWFFIPFHLLAYHHYTSQKTEPHEFNPWYTGPLLTPSASCLDPGSANIQPYVFYTVIDSSNGNITNVDTLSFLQYGLLKFLDVTFTFHYLYNHQKHINASGYGDTSLSFGIQLLRQKIHTAIPSIRITIGESFPTAKYNNLNPKKLGLDGFGKGSFSTNFSFNLSKIVYWITLHPISFRFVTSLSIPSLVLVKDFNSYGGGYNTYGKVRPPILLSPQFSLEYSFNQRWVYAMDINYLYTTRRTFAGDNGTNSDGTVASSTSGPSQTLSIAPGIEYNFNENLGIITGFWFPIYRKNSSDFFSYIFSFTYTF